MAAAVTAFHERNAREVASVVADVRIGMAADEAETLLAARKFRKSTGCAGDGDEFSFSKPVARDVAASYFWGSVGAKRRTVMIPNFPYDFACFVEP